MMDNFELPRQKNSIRKLDTIDFIRSFYCVRLQFVLDGAKRMVALYPNNTRKQQKII